MTYITKQDNFYHISSAGALGAPQENDYQSPPQSRLLGLIPHLDHCCQSGSHCHLPWPGFRIFLPWVRHGRFLQGRPPAWY